MTKKHRVLHFKIIRKGERFWVQPIGNIKDGYKVKVKNDCIENRYKWGDIIKIKRKEIVEANYF